MILGAFRFTILGWQQQQMIPLRWNWICGKFRSDAGHSVRLVDTPDSFRYHSSSFFEQAYWRTFTPVKRSNNSIGLWNPISLFFSAIVKSTVTALNSDNPFFSLAISIKKYFLVSQKVYFYSVHFDIFQFKNFLLFHWNFLKLIKKMVRLTFQFPSYSNRDMSIF